MSEILFKNLALLDAAEGTLKSGHQVLVRDGLIAEVAKGAINAPKAEGCDLGGRTLMPGLIDCHVHIHRTVLPPVPLMLPSLITAYAGRTLGEMLMRGFTTVRDAGGADLGHKQAIERGFFDGPRLFVSGRAISQTGGHGDPRSPADQRPPCECVHLVAGIGRIADGVAEVRQAVRDEIRLGADQIKVMAGGGVGSIADPIDQLQYSIAELEAIVDEAARSHTYVLAHVYAPDGIGRCIEAGVRTIEHGNFLDDQRAKMMTRAGTYLSPNLIIYRILVERGRELGYPDVSIAKAKEVLDVGARALDVAKRHGVKMAYSTDLSKVPEYQSDEFLIRGEILPAADIIRSATLVGAEVVRMAGKIGVIAPGAHADLLVVDGDPFGDLRLLTEQGRHLPAIMKGGTFYKNALVH